MIRKAALLALTPIVLLQAGCGLQPMYAGGSSGTVARGLAGIEVPPIEGRAGWLMRNALRDRLGGNGTAAPRYRLDVRLDDSLEGLGVLGDDTIGRERRTLRARYQLVEAASGESCWMQPLVRMPGSMWCRANMPPSLQNRLRWKISRSKLQTV